MLSTIRALFAGLVPLLAVVQTFPLNAAGIEDIRGIWRTEGYGYVLEITEHRATLYETTSISCLESVLSLSAFSPSDKAPLLGSFSAQVPGFIDARMEVRKGEGQDSILLRRSDTVTQMTARRLDRLPALCKADTAASNAVSLQIFKQTFLEHYAFLNQSRADALASLAKRETDKIEDRTLFDKLTTLARDTGDQHAAVIAPYIDGYYFGDEEFAASVDEDLKLHIDTLIRDDYLKGMPQIYGGDQIVFGTLKAGPAYLRLDGFSGYDPSGNNEKDAQILSNAMKNFMPQIDPLYGLVIDLRSNRGGSDEIALSLAGMMTKEKYPAYRKQALSRVGGNDLVWDVGFIDEVLPVGEVQYSGKITILTSQQTISAAETFLMAMMNRKPEVIRVGERTAGAFSDRLPRTLPNGWLFSLSNERYLDQNGVSYEGHGIAPDIRVPAFPRSDIEAGQDTALDRAIQALTSGKN